MRRVLLLLLALPALAGELRVGRAAVKITPPAGMPMAGYYSIRLNEGVHDDLFAKAIVLEHGGVRAALVACDVVSIPRAFAEEARTLIERETGIPGAHVMISATHTHTGPEMGARLVNVDPKTLDIVQTYHAQLPRRIAESVRVAAENLRPGRVRKGVGREESVAFIRRYWMKDGTVKWNPGKRNPGIVEPAGEIDPDVPVVSFEDAEGAPLAVYVNYANHLDTVGGMQFSADYPYALGKILGEALGGGTLTVFTEGCAGNVNHIDVRSPAPQKGHAEAARIGAILAGEVLRTFRRLTPAAGEIQVSREMVALPLVSLEPGDVERAREVIAQYGKPGAPAFYEQVKAFKVMEVAARQGKPIEAEVQVIALGRDLAWVGLPSEIFVEIGKAIKLGSPFPVTIVASLANGSFGYIPDRRAYPQGQYEVINTPVAAGGGEMLAASAVRQLIELHARAKGGAR
jgi:hypothetical protein